MKRLIVFAVAALVSTSLAATAVAQETPPAEAGPATGRYLPDASVFGQGWSQTDLGALQVASDIFQEASYAVYGGPTGARVVVSAYLTTDTRAAVRQSWEEVTTIFDRARFNVATDYDYSQLERLEGLEPPAGCVEAKRFEGIDPDYAYTAGGTMCALDPDVIVVAIVSGAVEDQTGYAASDSAIAQALAAAGA